MAFCDSCHVPGRILAEKPKWKDVDQDGQPGASQVYLSLDPYQRQELTDMAERVLYNPDYSVTEEFKNRLPIWTRHRLTEHIDMVRSHRYYIRLVHERFLSVFDEVSFDTIMAHDLSKVTSFYELVGQTDRWVWGQETAMWSRALRTHYELNDHHPEYHLSSDVKQENMTKEALQESLVDMVSARWERRLHGNPKVTSQELGDLLPQYLTRYTDFDRAKVLVMLEDIKEHDQVMEGQRRLLKGRHEGEQRRRRSLKNLQGGGGGANSSALRARWNEVVLHSGGPNPFKIDHDNWIKWVEEKGHRRYANVYT